MGKTLSAVYHTARQIHNKKQGDGNNQKKGIAVYFLCFHAAAPPFANSLFADIRFINALKGGAWIVTIIITTIALYTGACSVDTPNAYNVVVIAWMV